MMNSKRGFKRVIFTLATVVALASGIFTGMVPYTEYRTARSFWELADPNWQIIVKEPSEQELQQFNAWKIKMGIVSDDYYVLEDPNSNMSFAHSLPTLMESRETFLRIQKTRYWKDLSKPTLVGLFILYILCGLVAGFLSVWLILWFGGLAIYKIIKWLILGFYDEVNIKQVETMEPRQKNSSTNPIRG